MDCETLSPNARKIFEQIVKHFQPDPWGNPQWTEDGKIYDNGWRDLRLAKDRDRCIEWHKSLIGYLVGLRASSYRNEHGSLDGFTSEHFTENIRDDAGLLLLIQDLDFQIETLDICES